MATGHLHLRPIQLIHRYSNVFFSSVQFTEHSVKFSVGGCRLENGTW
jgi:hypothetical protein